MFDERLSIDGNYISVCIVYNYSDDLMTCGDIDIVLLAYGIPNLWLLKLAITTGIRNECLRFQCPYISSIDL